MTSEILERNRSDRTQSRIYCALVELFELLNQSITHSEKLADEVSEASQKQHEHISRSASLLENVSERIRSNALKSQQSEKDSRDLRGKSAALLDVAHGFSR